MAPDLLAEPGQVGGTGVGLPIAGPGGSAGHLARQGGLATVGRSPHERGSPGHGFPGQVFPGRGFPGRGFPGRGFPGAGLPRARPSAVPLTAPLRRWNSSRMVLAQK